MTVRNSVAASLLCAVTTCAMGQELLTDPGFSAGTPAATLKGWRVFGPLGGTVKPLADGGVLLGTEPVQLPDGSESWQGALAGNMIEVVPGRKYRFRVEARGIGRLSFGVFEYGWKYSAKVLAEAGADAHLTPGPQAYEFEYTPTMDRVSHVRPFVRVSGWWRRAELLRASFTSAATSSRISIVPRHFLAMTGEHLPVVVESEHYPVKILLYGSTGTSGPGGDMGGSPAFTDIFKTSLQVDGRQGGPVTIPVPIPPDALEGSYRLVAVDPASGAAATSHFTVMPRGGAMELLALLDRVKLQPGSTLVFVGDSLTANFPNRNYPALLDRALGWRYGGEVKVINAGVGGNNIEQIAARLEKDVIARKPTHVFLFEGGNDCKRPYRPADGTLGDWAVPPDRYEQAYRDVVSRLADSGAKVVVMTCAPGDPQILSFFANQKKVFSEGGNLFCMPEEVEKCVAIQKRVAAEYHTDVIDTHHLLTRYLNDRGPGLANQHPHVDDGVHLSEYGAREVARIVLEYLGR